MTQSEMLLSLYATTQKWQLSEQEFRILLGVQNATESALAELAQRNALPADLVKRMLLLHDIAQCLNALLPGGAADGWVRRQNAAFENQTALHVMLSGGERGIERVLRYLKAVIWS